MNYWTVKMEYGYLHRQTGVQDLCVTRIEVLPFS
jgi:hypothetical protein